jgi:predicted GH43/DUF377 family glycosyl hydrolase
MRVTGFLFLLAPFVSGQITITAARLSEKPVLEPGPS